MLILVLFLLTLVYWNKQKHDFLLKVALQIHRAKRCYNSNTVSNKYISATCTAAAQKTPLYLQFVRLW